jgi:LmbE family N-acetylglucosaminyl deacetylase
MLSGQPDWRTIFHVILWYEEVDDKMGHSRIPFALLLLACPAFALSQAQTPSASAAPRVLLVTAHPDDDAAFAGAVYQITHQLKGVVDLALVTDGGGGFRYATLAEPIYGLGLTNEEVARQYLPAIRKRELMAGGAIVGIRNYFFLDELDHEFTLNADTVLTAVWDSSRVRRRLAEIMERGRYHLAIGLLPFPQMHGHHKAATMLAMHAALSVPSEKRPTVLGGFPCSFGDEAITFEGLPDFPVTQVSGGRPLVQFDRTQKFGANDRLDFRIVVNWVIAEHKSQGTMQLLMNRGDQECYWYFDANGPSRRERVVALFDQLRVP